MIGTDPWDANEFRFTVAFPRVTCWLMTTEQARKIELVWLDPLGTKDQLEELCGEVRESGFYGIALPSSQIEAAYDAIGDSDLKLTCLVGYPFGTADADVKRFEAEVAADFGAHEIELLPSLSLIREGNHPRFLRELRDVVEAADERPVKVVIEAGLLSRPELEHALQAVLESGAQYVATASGFFEGASASLDDLRLLRELAGPKFGLKAGGVEDEARAIEFLEAGADRVGLIRRNSEDNFSPSRRLSF